MKFREYLKEDVISQLKGIVKDHQSEKVAGQMVDVQSANAILQVYDALKPDTRKKYIKMPIKKMSDFAWSMMK